MYCYVYCYVVVGLTRDIECYVVLLTCLQCYVVTQDYKVPAIIFFFLNIIISVVIRANICVTLLMLNVQININRIDFIYIIKIVIKFIMT